MNVGMLGALAIFAFGFAFFMIGWRRVKKNKNLKENGIKTEALITGMLMDYLDTDNSTSYTVNVSFKDEKGHYIEGQLPFSPGADFAKRYSEGSYIDIVYFPGDSSVFTAVDEDFTDMLSVLFMSVGVLCMFLAFFVLYQSIFNFE